MKIKQYQLVEAMRAQAPKLRTKEAVMKYIRDQGYTFARERFKAAWAVYERSASNRGEDVLIGKPAQAAALPAEIKPLVAGTVKSPDTRRQRASGTRFILTCAQNNTKIHNGFWRALQRFADDKQAQIMVSRFSYNKTGWGQQHLTKDSKQTDQGEELWYAPEIMPFVQDTQIKIANGLLFCAELDILPTAKDPLSGLDNYTGVHSAIVPHVKVHMRSYAGLLSGQPQRFGYTTGTCTLRNYIDRRAGQIASYHHVYGALYVEVSASGKWFARQINATDDGAFWDIDTYYAPDKPPTRLPSEVDTGKVVNLGDIHAEKMDEQNFKTAMDFLRALEVRKIAVHDLEDFEARNHHNIKDPFFRAEQHFNGANTVKANFEKAVLVLNEIHRSAPAADMLLIRSNHDQAFDRWLRTFDGQNDPANAAFFHYHMWQRYKAIELGGTLDNYKLAITEAAKSFSIDTSNWVHVLEDDSYVAYEIELGLHGHLGPNGAKGSPKGYRQLGRKLNTGHTHSAGIIDGIWTAGLLASLRMGYNKGPSSWSCSHILTHSNSKRQMITQQGDEWRA